MPGSFDPQIPPLGVFGSQRESYAQPALSELLQGISMRPRLLAEVTGYSGIVHYLLEILPLAVGGAAFGYLLSHFQKSMERRGQLLQEFAMVHGKFVALRYRYNALFEGSVKDEDEAHLIDSETRHSVQSASFQEACDLLGEFHSIKPLLLENFSAAADQFNAFQNAYHLWRQNTQVGKPILLDADGSNSGGYNNLRDEYSRATRRMRRRI